MISEKSLYPLLRVINVVLPPFEGNDCMRISFEGLSTADGFSLVWKER